MFLKSLLMIADLRADNGSYIIINLIVNPNQVRIVQSTACTVHHKTSRRLDKSTMFGQCTVNHTRVVLLLNTALSFSCVVNYSLA